MQVAAIRYTNSHDRLRIASYVTTSITGVLIGAGVARYLARPGEDVQMEIEHNNLEFFHKNVYTCLSNNMKEIIGGKAGNRGHGSVTDTVTAIIEYIPENVVAKAMKAESNAAFTSKVSREAASEAGIFNYKEPAESEELSI
jgi:hypothetical protein